MFILPHTVSRGEYPASSNISSSTVNFTVIHQSDLPLDLSLHTDKTTQNRNISGNSFITCRCNQKTPLPFDKQSSAKKKKSAAKATRPETKQWCSQWKNCSLQDRSRVTSTSESMVGVFFDIYMVIHHKLVLQGQTVKTMMFWGRKFGANDLNCGSKATRLSNMTTCHSEHIENMPASQP